MNDLTGGDRDPAAAIRPDSNASAQKLGQDTTALLQLFLDQSSPIRSIVAVGNYRVQHEMGKDAPNLPSIRSGGEAVLLRLVTDKDGTPVIAPPISLQPSERRPSGVNAYALDSLARQAGELAHAAPGIDLLLSRADALNDMMTPLTGDFDFRAVAVLSSQPSAQPGNEDARQLRRRLFDRGLICIGGVQLAGENALCFLASDAVRSLRRREVGSHGHVTMSALGSQGRFGNQLFQYAYVKLYALRHGATAVFPPWEGNQLFGLDDDPCAGLTLRKLAFNAFSDEDRLLWNGDEPPIDVDFSGYFQEIPECWRRHRPLIRRLFQPSLEIQRTVDAWHRDVTRGGERTLVAIHVRRGDYRLHQHRNTPWFRLVPEEWYLDWLRIIWPTLRHPLLFIASDEPAAVLPAFQEFDSIATKLSSGARSLPDHVRDFEILKRADHLAIGNSSFSRMAAILAPSTQKCVLPSFLMQKFLPYEPWIDPAFWARFADSWRATPPRKERPGQAAETANSKHALEAPTQPAAILLDVSDLLLYLLGHPTLSGIQRVQCEVLRNLLDASHMQPVRVVVLNDVGSLDTIEQSALLGIIEDIRSDTASRARLRSQLRALLNRASPYTISQRDIFLSIGAFWTVRGMGLLLQQLKNLGVTIGLFVHDIIPITAPEYFKTRDAKVFVKGVVEALTFADFILTGSAYNKSSLAKHMAARKAEPIPVHIVPLGHELSKPGLANAAIAAVITEIAEMDYVLCVGTIEVRKNPLYLFNIWKLMVESERPNVPFLVFAGRQGWLVRDFMDQLEACNYLDGRIVVLHNVTDVELDLLYRKCMLTMFPSFDEGWGLPVAESLAHGKISICSAKGGIPEVGGELADYIDPYNPRQGLELLSRYLDDPDLRRDREREIARRFQPRSWRAVADDLITSTRGLAPQVRSFEGIAAITLPPDRYLPICPDAGANPITGMDGSLSADLICVSGWRLAEIGGAQADEPTSMLRFRTDAPVGAKINLIIRLAAYGSDPCRIRISTGSGANTEALVKSGSDSLAVLSCEVEPGQLVTAHLSAADTTPDASHAAHAPYWSLEGILYFEPKRLGEKAAEKLTDGRRRQLRSARSLHGERPGRAVDTSSRKHIPLHPAAEMDDRQQATSLGAFVQSADSYWPSVFTSCRAEPIFADSTDRRMFLSGCGNSADVPRIGKIRDRLKLIKCGDQFVSMSRFTEGSVFDRSGVRRGLGYFESAPPTFAPWLSKEADGLKADEGSLAAAPRYESSYLIFYNGNLHNYYHWLIEGLLTLDILSRALGPNPNLTIALPKSTEIDARFDHRDSLRAVGLDGYDIVEVAENLIRVREAIWVDSDLVQSMPAPYLKDFQQRVAARYSGLRASRTKRLLVARRGPARAVHNIDQVEAFLARYGFETVYLEGMSVTAQILLFQSAEFIIGAHGAGLANLLFCEPGTKVIEFMPAAELRPFFWLISDKLNLVHGMQFCAAREGEGFQAALDVDIGKLQALLHMVDDQLERVLK